MKQLVGTDKLHNFPQIPEDKKKVVVGHMDLSKDKEVKLFK